MPFQVDPERVFVFDYEIDEGDWVQVTFDFPWSEEIDYGPLRLLLKDVSNEQKSESLKKLRTGKKLSKSDAKVVEEAQSVQVFYNLLRTSLVGCEGFENRRTKEEIQIKDKGGNIIENNQKAIFEFVKNTAKLFEKVCLAYAGELDSGNVKVGLQPPLSTVGVQQNATDVT